MNDLNLKIKWKYRGNFGAVKQSVFDVEDPFDVEDLSFFNT